MGRRHTFARVLQRAARAELVTWTMGIAGPTTDWSLLSALLRRAQRDGWEVSFRNGSVSVAHPRAARGVVVLPAALLEHARGSGWSVARGRNGFELRHRAVRHRIELRLAT